MDVPKLILKTERKLNTNDSFELDHIDIMPKSTKMDKFGKNSTHTKDMVDIYKRSADVRKLEMLYFKDKFAMSYTNFDPCMVYGALNIFKKQ